MPHWGIQASEVRNNIFLVFMLTAGTYGLKYYYLNYYPPYWIVEPILMGIWSVICYLLLFGILIMFTEEKKIFPMKRTYTFRNERVNWTEEEQELLNDIETST